jgi:hypothetical protein
VPPDISRVRKLKDSRYHRNRSLGRLPPVDAQPAAAAEPFVSTCFELDRAGSTCFAAASSQARLRSSRNSTKTTLRSYPACGCACAQMKSLQPFKLDSSTVGQLCPTECPSGIDALLTFIIRFILTQQAKHLTRPHVL